MSEEDRSEEMMLDQPVFSASSSRDNLNQKQTLSGDFNYFTDSLTESNMHQTFSASEDLDFNSSTESREINDQKGRTGLDDVDKNSTETNEPMSSLSDALDVFEQQHRKWTDEGSAPSNHFQ